MDAVLIVGVIAGVALLTAFFLWYPWCLKRRPGRRFGSSSPQSGLVRGMDEIWHPEAVAPAQARDAETRWVEPAPTPDPESDASGIRAAIDARLGLRPS